MAKKVNDEAEVSVEVPAPKIIKLTASFKARDEQGDRIVKTFQSEGKTIEEALANMEFPKGVNALVTLEVKKGDKVLTKALASHKARQILEHKSVEHYNGKFAPFFGF